MPFAGIRSWICALSAKRIRGLRRSMSAPWHGVPVTTLSTFTVYRAGSRHVPFARWTIANGCCKNMAAKDLCTMIRGAYIRRHRQREAGTARGRTHPSTVPVGGTPHDAQGPCGVAPASYVAAICHLAHKCRATHRRFLIPWPVRRRMPRSQIRRRQTRSASLRVGMGAVHRPRASRS